MKYNDLQYEKLDVTVDLKKIIKYHPAAAIFKDHAKTSSLRSYKTRVSFIYRTIEYNGKTTFHPAYDIFNLSGRFISDQDLHNLLFLVQSLISLEWNYYNHHVLDDDPRKDIYTKDASVSENFWTLASCELEEILHLLELRDINKFQEGKLTLSFNSKFSKKPIRITSDNAVFASMVEELISEKFKNLKDSRNPLLESFLESIDAPTFSNLSKVYEFIKIDFEHTRAFGLFQALVVKKILKYLNSETSTITPGGEVLTADQARIIYPLLSLFRLIKDELILKHKIPRDRINYTRSILVSPDNNYLNSKLRKKQPNFLELKFIEK